MLTLLIFLYCAGYECAGVSSVAYGLIAREVERSVDLLHFYYEITVFQSSLLLCLKEGPSPQVFCHFLC